MTSRPLRILAALCLGSALQAQSLRIEVQPSDLHQFSPSEVALVDSIARATVRDVRAILPGLPDSLVLELEATREVIDVTGEGGVTPMPGRIRWSVDPSREGGVAATARRSLRHTLFHELHHLARGWTVRGGRPISGIMDAVIAEGLATVFARSYAGHQAPWGEPPADVEAWVAELRALPPSALREYLTWMMQHPDGRRWIGYRAGTHIVERAVARSQLSVIALTQRPTAEILALAYPD